MRVLQVILVFLLTFLPTVRAARRPELKFLKATDLPAIRLKVRLMPDATATPLPPPQVHTYQFTSADKTRTWKADMYAPRDLWLRSQHAGQWTDPSGNTLTLATISHPMPTGFKKPHISREDYNQAMDGPARTDWTAPDMLKWVQDFTGASRATGAPVKKPLRLKSLAFFALQGVPANTFAYAFRLNRPATRSAESPEWYFALFQVNPQVSSAKARQAIEKSFFGTLATSVASRASGNLSNRFQLYSGKNDAARSAEFLQSRNQALASIANMASWWSVVTDNYVMLSNLSSRYAVAIKQLQQNLELLRGAYAHAIPPRVDIKAVSVIRVFANSEEYARYVGPKYQWSGGLWMPQRKELVIRPIDWGGSKDQRDRIFKTTYHEAFHQYLFYALDQAHVSVWFNEGHAEFFEMADVRNGRLTIPESDSHVELLEKMIAAGTASIPRLLSLSHENFYNTTDDQRNENYTLAWAMIYYLRKAAPLEKPNRYGDVIPRYLKTLAETKHPGRATAAAFEGLSVETFQADMITFWSSRNRRGAARRHQLFSPQSLRSR